MPISAGSAEMMGASIGSQKVRRAVLNGKTVYEPLSKIALEKDTPTRWVNIPTNSLCYPSVPGGKAYAIFRWPVTCNDYCRVVIDGTSTGLMAGKTIPAGALVRPDYPTGWYTFTRV